MDPENLNLCHFLPIDVVLTHFHRPSLFKLYIGFVHGPSLDAVFNGQTGDIGAFSAESVTVFY